MWRTLLVLLVPLGVGPTALAGEGEETGALPKSILDLLARSESIELLSLHPAMDPAKAKGQFIDRAVLGSTVLKGREARENLLRAFADAVAATSRFEVGLCFRPRHGLRAKVGGKTVEVGICFECSRVEVYVDGKEQAVRGIAPAGQKYLDDLLTAAKVPLAPKPAKGK